MSRLKLAVLYALCAPWDGLLGPVALWLRALGAGRPRLAGGVAWLDVREGLWIERHWRYSTTLGHWVLLQADLAGTSVEAHELVHVRQYEGAVCSVWLAAVSAAAVRASGFGAAALALVALFGPWWSYAGASLAAWLRGERPYLDNHFERHARADVQERLHEPPGWAKDSR